MGRLKKKVGRGSYGVWINQVVKVPNWAVIDVKFVRPQKNDLLRELPRIEYANYCVIDNEVRLRYSKIQQILFTMDGDKFPDSGWRLLGQGGGIPACQEIRYEPLYCALDSDDSWLHLIDKPVGTAFERDPKTGLFFEVESPPRSRLSS